MQKEKGKKKKDTLCHRDWGFNKKELGGPIFKRY